MDEFYRVRPKDSSLVLLDSHGATEGDYQLAKDKAIKASRGNETPYYVYYCFNQNETAVGHAINGEWHWR